MCDFHVFVFIWEDRITYIYSYCQQFTTIWEHFTLQHTPSYCWNWKQKFGLYSSNWMYHDTWEVQGGEDGDEKRVQTYITDISVCHCNRYSSLQCNPGHTLHAVWSRKILYHIDTSVHIPFTRSLCCHEFNSI